MQTDKTRRLGRENRAKQNRSIESRESAAVGLVENSATTLVEIIEGVIRGAEGDSELMVRNGIQRHAQVRRDILWV